MDVFASIEAQMRDAEHSSRRRPIARVTASAVVVLALVLVGLLPLSGHVAAATTHSRNLFVAKGFVYQDPYYTACTAASVMHMLNTIAYRGTGGYGFRWKPYTVKKSSNPDQLRDMTSILAFERRNDTLRSSTSGSDAHGWRNALNYYGWGSSAMTNASIRPYEDRAYSTYRSAMKAAVRAIARLGMPVGVLAWAGGHAQVITGYVVTGADPKTSSDFTIQWLYLSDPLKSSAIVNRKTSYGAMKDGALKWRFQWYRETDSPYDDPYTSGWIRSSVKPTTGPSEWYHKWVLVLPVRRGLPPPEPAPTPTPTPDARPGSASPATRRRARASACTGRRHGLAERVARARPRRRAHRRPASAGRDTVADRGAVAVRIAIPDRATDSATDGAADRATDRATHAHRPRRRPAPRRRRRPRARPPRPDALAGWPAEPVAARRSRSAIASPSPRSSGGHARITSQRRVELAGSRRRAVARPPPRSSPGRRPSRPRSARRARTRAPRPCGPRARSVAARRRLCGRLDELQPRVRRVVRREHPGRAHLAALADRERYAGDRLEDLARQAARPQDRRLLARQVDDRRLDAHR